MHILDFCIIQRYTTTLTKSVSTDCLVLTFPPYAIRPVRVSKVFGKIL